MKSFVSILSILLLSLSASFAQSSQHCITETFSGTTGGWTYSQGAHVGNYTNPANSCVDDRGIITPGVGGNNPCNIMTNEFVSAGANHVDLTFDIIVLNANLKCNTWKNYACETSIDVFYYVGGQKFTAIVDQLLPPNGPENPTLVSLSFNTGDNLPPGTPYKIEMCFKPKSGVGNCIQQNTKYVFDNFRNCETVTSRTDINERNQTAPVKAEINAISAFNVYPNTTRGAAKITVNAEAQTKLISLVDANGKVLQSVSGTSFMMFSVKDLPNGKYYMQFEQPNGDQIRKQLIINK